MHSGYPFWRSFLDTLSNYLIWLSFLAILPGYPFWQPFLAILSGNPFWLPFLAILFGYPVWLSFLAILSRNPFWLSFLDILPGYPSWLSCLAILSGNPFWLSFLATETCEHGNLRTHTQTCRLSETDRAERTPSLRVPLAANSGLPNIDRQNLLSQPQQRQPIGGLGLNPRVPYNEY